MIYTAEDYKLAAELLGRDMRGPTGQCPLEYRYGEEQNCNDCPFRPTDGTKDYALCWANWAAYEAAKVNKRIREATSSKKENNSMEVNEKQKRR